MRIRSLSEFHLIYQILSKHTENQYSLFYRWNNWGTQFLTEEDTVQGHGIETQKQAEGFLSSERCILPLVLAPSGSCLLQTEGSHATFSKPGMTIAMEEIATVSYKYLAL